MSGMDIHTLTIKRASTTRGALGGNRTTYTLAARGSLPTSVRGRMVAMSAKEKIDHGLRAEQFMWKGMVPYERGDPQVDQRDQVTFEYTPGDTRTVKVTVPGRGRIGESSTTPHHYTFFGLEDNTES